MFYAIDSPAGIYVLKFKNRDTRIRCEICSKLTIKSPERRHWRYSGVFIVNFKTYFTPCSSVSIVNFEHVNAGREFLFGLLDAFYQKNFIGSGKDHI